MLGDRLCVGCRIAVEFILSFAKESGTKFATGERLAEYIGQSPWKDS